MLPKATHVEVALHFRPLAVGSLNMVMNITEQGTGAFIDALLICTHARAPHVSRMFEVDLPIGCTVHKKVRCWLTYADAPVHDVLRMMYYS